MITLSMAHIVTEDVPKLAQFYEALLEAPAIGSEEYVAIRTRGATLAICSQCAFDVYGLYGAGETSMASPGSNRSVILDFEVDDVDAHRRRLDLVVGAFVVEPTTQPWGNRSMLFRDPDGNLINFFTVTHERHSH